MSFGPKIKGPSEEDKKEAQRKERAKKKQGNASVARIVQGRVGRKALINPGLFVPGGSS